MYRRLVDQDGDDPPDFVIGGKCRSTRGQTLCLLADAAVETADTVVIRGDEILEKPADETDQLRMLADLNGSSVRSNHTRLKKIQNLLTPTTFCTLL